ncbi:MAG: hypothetical protein ABUL49_00640 [bacterium]
MKIEWTWTMQSLVAVVALAQPWLIALYKKWRKTKVRVDLRGLPEIGFSGFGNTLGIIGVIHCGAGSVFVRDMKIKVCRTEDDAKATLEWLAIKSLKITPAVDETSIATGFVVSESSPVPFNIVFVSKVPWDEHLNRYRLRSEEIRNEVQNNRELDMTDEDVVIKTTYLLTNDQVGVEVWSRIDKSLFWQTGNYECELHLSLADGRQVNCSKVKFYISEDQSKTLGYNAVGILDSARNLEPHFNFIYPGPAN